MINKYRVTVYCTDITPIKIVRETEKTVFLPRSALIGGERRKSKMSTFTCYFDTWNEAHEYLLNSATRKLKQAINCTKKNSIYLFIERLVQLFDNYKKN